jgi:hypothetical protein
MRRAYVALRTPKGDSTMAIQIGDRIPDVPLTLATPEGPVPVKSGDYFAGKRVALFAVPGAYTPTCSARHLPSYVEKAAELPASTMHSSWARGTAIRDPRTSPCWPTATASLPKRLA